MRHKRRRLQRQRRKTALALSVPWGTRGQENPRRGKLIALRGKGTALGTITWVSCRGFGVQWPREAATYTPQDWDRFA